MTMTNATHPASTYDQPLSVPAPRPRPRRAEAPPPDWACANCTQPNSGRRRRCLDCGTSRS